MSARRRHTLPVLFVLLSVLSVGLEGCQNIPARSVFESIDLAYASITTVAEETAVLCGHTVIGGPCRPDALITTETKLEIKQRLQQAHDRLGQANLLAGQGDIIGAEGKVAQATAILTVIRALLAESEREGHLLDAPAAKQEHVT